MRRLPTGITLLLTAVLLLTGCATDPAGTPTTGTSAARTAAAGPAETEPSTETSTLAAVARGPVVPVRSTPEGSVALELDNPTKAGAPLTLMVVARSGDWLEVQLPIRPNGSTGWIAAGDVDLTEVPFRLDVSTATNEMRLYRAGELEATYPVATGTGGTPTPQGTFYLTELLAPTNSGYGPYAYGLSAFSEVLFDFGGGPGQIGLHGTADEASIGQAASHGCIRMSNADITELAALLPLGTPVHVA